MNRKTVPILSALLIAALAVVASVHRPEPGEGHVFAGPTMGTAYHVTLAQDPGAALTEEIASEIKGTLARINGRMSTYDPASELSRFNDRTSTEWFEVSRETLQVIRAAQEISTMTGGAFDVTVGPLVDLWGFGPGPSTDAPPSPREIDDLLQSVGYGQLELRDEPPAIRKLNPDLRVDLSAIAKGYAVDAVAQVLERSGIADYLVEVGGEIRASGVNPEGRPWQIAIEKPLAAQRVPHRVVGIDNLALATSGDYRNFFEFQGRRYAHTIDPRTGMPVAYKTASVSVLDPSGMRADALATALLAMGPGGFDFAERNDIPALVLERDGQGLLERETSAFQRYRNSVERGKEGP